MFTTKLGTFSQTGIFGFSQTGRNDVYTVLLFLGVSRPSLAAATLGAAGDHALAPVAQELDAASS
eukprot:5703184-Prymnesium_polylepis.1